VRAYRDSRTTILLIDEPMAVELADTKVEAVGGRLLTPMAMAVPR
jgi:hypothetical protein